MKRIPADIATPKAFFIAPLGDTTKSKAARDLIFDCVSKVSKDHGLKCERDVETRTADQFERTIKRKIRWSHLVICDLSDERPNCYYELGYAVALERPLCLIAKKGTNVHHDVRGNQVFFYKDAADIHVELGQWIADSHALRNDEAASDDDPLCGKYGARALVDGYLLTGHVVPDPARESDGVSYSAHARVISVRPRRKLTGKVYFHFDGTFPTKCRVVTAKNGVAQIDIGEVYGAFTLGVTIETTDTKLELNTRYVPGSDATFRYE